MRLIATNHFMPENLDPFLPFPQWFKDIVSRNSWADMGRLMSRASVVTTPTPLAAKTMKAKGGFEHVLPLSNGIDVDFYSPKPEEELPRHERPTVLFVGRLAVEKNVGVLIDALARTDPQLGLCAEIIGDGEQRDVLREQILQQGLEDRVTMRGHVDEAGLRSAYLAADVFCQPGTAELQSLVSLEAMSAAKPMVLADALALPHLVTEGQNGYLFDPNNSADLAEKLNTIFRRTPQQRQAMGDASRKKAGSTPSANRCRPTKSSITELTGSPTDSSRTGEPSRTDAPGRVSSHRREAALCETQAGLCGRRWWPDRRRLIGAVTSQDESRCAESPSVGAAASGGSFAGSAEDGRLLQPAYCRAAAASSSGLTTWAHHAADVVPDHLLKDGQIRDHHRCAVAHRLNDRQSIPLSAGRG